MYKTRDFDSRFLIKYHTKKSEKCWDNVLLIHIKGTEEGQTLYDFEI